jgi:hypothetical protein
MADIKKLVPKADMVNVDADVSPITYTPEQTTYSYDPTVAKEPVKEAAARVQYLASPGSQYAVQPIQIQQTYPVYNPAVTNNPANTTATPSTVDALKTISKYADMGRKAVNTNTEPVAGTPDYYENKINTAIANSPILNTVDNAATGIGMYQLGDLLTKKGLSKSIAYIGSKVGLGAAARIGLKFVPGLGWISLAYDVGKAVAPYVLSNMNNDFNRNLEEVKKSYPTLDNKSAETLARVQGMTNRTSSVF